MDKPTTGKMSVEDAIGDVRRDVAELCDRLVMNEGVLFALLEHLGLAPGQEIIRTGTYHNPHIFRGAVIQKNI